MLTILILVGVLALASPLVMLVERVAAALARVAWGPREAACLASRGGGGLCLRHRLCGVAVFEAPGCVAQHHELVGDP